MTPDHISYSSLTSYDSCPRSYYLSRVKKAWSVPAWYFIVGTTVHAMIEQLLDPKSPDPSPALLEEYFMDLVKQSMEVEPATSKWLAGGSKESPVIEERALKLAQDCYAEAIVFLEDVDVHHVEHDVTGYLPGCSMEIKAFPDLIGEHSKHGLLIVDWKTGKSRQKDSVQLETYNALYGKPGFKGMYVMLNPYGPNHKLVEFTRTPEEIGAVYADLEKKIQSKVAKPNPNYMCKFCTMKPNCTTQSGKTQRAVYYDTPEQDGWFPF